MLSQTNRDERVSSERKYSTESNAVKGLDKFIFQRSFILNIVISIWGYLFYETHDFALIFSLFLLKQPIFPRPRQQYFWCGFALITLPYILNCNVFLLL